MSDSPSETLRAAAKWPLEVANAATPGPWPRWKTHSRSRSPYRSRRNPPMADTNERDQLVVVLRDGLRSWTIESEAWTGPMRHTVHATVEGAVVSLVDALEAAGYRRPETDADAAAGPLASRRQPSEDDVERAAKALYEHSPGIKRPWSVYSPVAGDHYRAKVRLVVAALTPQERQDG